MAVSAKEQDSAVDEVPYLIGKVSPNYASTFTYRDLLFHIHRPVSESGVKLDKGWQVSHEGIPVSRMEIDTKPKAVAYFTKTLTKQVPDDDDLKGLLTKCKNDNRSLWNLS